jgi:hypothetical protein
MLGKSPDKTFLLGVGLPSHRMLQAGQLFDSCMHLS